MRSMELRVEVGDAEVGEAVTNAATAHLPEGRPIAVVVAFPGGGYGRRYFDLADQGYSQARHHTDRGVALIACDHLGVGDSDQPSIPVSWERIAAASDTVSRRAVVELGLEGIPLVGIGQSYGG